MISAQPGPRSAVAVCRCDDCGAEILIPCEMDRVRFKKGRGSNAERTINEGSARKKLQQRGWRADSRSIACPDCQQSKKIPQPIKEFSAMAGNTQPIPPTNIMQSGFISLAADLRTPTREQKRQIIDMLTAVYDTKASRYTGAETDLTVAEAIGGGILFGWVAQIREDLFGPAGGNAEMEALRDDLLLMVDTYGTQLARVNEQIAEASRVLDVLRVDRGELAKVVERVTAMSVKLDRICKSVGPKGAL